MQSTELRYVTTLWWSALLASWNTKTAVLMKKPPKKPRFRFPWRLTRSPPGSPLIFHLPSGPKTSVYPLIVNECVQGPSRVHSHITEVRTAQSRDHRGADWLHRLSCRISETTWAQIHRNAFRYLTYRFFDLQQNKTWSSDTFRTDRGQDGKRVDTLNCYAIELFSAWVIRTALLWWWLLLLLAVLVFFL